MVKFFSGKTEAITKCSRCGNQGIRTEPFFTYSLSLPEVSEFEYSYYLVRRRDNAPDLPVRYGITLPRKASTQLFLTAVSQAQKISTDCLSLYTVFNNELLSKL